MFDMTDSTANQLAITNAFKKIKIASPHQLSSYMIKNDDSSAA